MQHQVTHGISMRYPFVPLCYHTMRAFSFIIVQLCNGYVYGCAFSVLFTRYLCAFFYLSFLKKLFAFVFQYICTDPSSDQQSWSVIYRSESNHMQPFFSFLFFCKIICTWMYSISWLLDWHHLLEPVTAGILMLHSLLNCQQVGILLVSNLSQKCPFYLVSL